MTSYLCLVACSSHRCAAFCTLLMAYWQLAIAHVHNVADAQHHGPLSGLVLLKHPLHHRMLAPVELPLIPTSTRCCEPGGRCWPHTQVPPWCQPHGEGRSDVAGAETTKLQCLLARPAIFCQGRCRQLVGARIANAVIRCLCQTAQQHLLTLSSSSRSSR